jgi:DNA repair protein RadC
MMSNPSTLPAGLSIKSWSEEDRPREKLLSNGKRSLSDSELIAILIGSGNTNESAVELSKRILFHVQHNLHSLSKLSVKELETFRGIGQAKAISVLAALELGRRMKRTEPGVRKEIRSSKVAYLWMQELLVELNYEEFWIILLNRSNRVISRLNISKGGVSGTIVDVKIVFKLAMENLASSIILCHNHPSGNSKPSESDVQLTKRMQQAGKIMDVPVIDHLIVCESSYFSFADEGLI